MKDEKKLDYLEDERRKIWSRLIELEDLIEKKTPEIESEARGAARKAVEHKNRSEEAKVTAVQNAEASKNSFEQIERLRLLTEENNEKANSLLDQITVTASAIATAHKKVESAANSITVNIEEIYRLYANHDDYLEKIRQLKQIFTAGDDYDSKLKALYQGMMTRKKEMDELYYDIIGYSETDEDSGEETKIPGKKEELEISFNAIKENIDSAEANIKAIEHNAIQNYSNFEKTKDNDFTVAFKKWESNYQAAVDKIESLLPNALTVGLSYAFSKKKDDEIEESNRHAVTFTRAIFGLVGVSLIPFAVSLISLVEKETFSEVLLRLPRLVLSILPLYIPVLWVAYSANRKVNLSKRLSEEYAHKEVLSKTFEGLSEQINSIENKNLSVDLRNKLLFNLLEVSSENPGKLISDYNKSDHPLMDALDKSVKLANAVEKLAKIPGFSKLAKVLDKKSKDVLEEKSKKASAGLETLETQEKE